MSEYHKIETLYERDLQTFRVKPGVFKNRTYSLLTGKDAEGLVGRPLEALFDKKGARLIVKLKTKDF